MRPIACFVLFLGALNFPAHAENRLSIGVGLWGIFDEADIGAVYISYEFNENERFWGVRPTVMVAIKSDDKFYLSSGVLKDFRIDQQWSWGVGINVGYFHVEDILGYDLEFYSRIKLDYSLNKKASLRAELGHISNAGFSDKNPGSEVFSFSYTLHF
jgi:hypothetical protein